MQNSGSPLSKQNSIQPGNGVAAKPVAQHTFIRGRNLLEQDSFARELSNVRPSWDWGLRIGPFIAPSDDATKHIALVGAPGSGKTVLMRLLMQSVLPRVGQDWKGAVPEQEARELLIAAAANAIPEIEPNPVVEEEVTESHSPYERICDELLAKFDGSTEQLLSALNYSGWDSLFTSIILMFFGGALGSWIFGMWVWVVIPLIPILVVRLASANKRILAPYLEMLGPNAKDIIRQYIADCLKPVTTVEPKRAPEPAAQTPIRRSYDGPCAWEMHRALVYDAKLEVIPQLAGMGLHAPVLILNPFDKRSVAWDMAVDITEPATAKQIASIFIPDEKNSSQPFFANAARQLMEGVMVAFILTRPHQWTLRDVLVALKSSSRLTAVLSSTPETKDLVETYLSNDKESKSIIATIGTKLGALDVVAALWESANSKVSLRDWLSSESILVLGNDEAYRASLDVINQVIFKRVVELLLAQPETTLGRTWFFLDEVKEAGNLDALGRLMTKGRSVGASVVLGFQDVDGMYEAFGENQAKSIFGQCATKVFLRLDSPETAKWAESVFGEYEAVEVKQSASLGESTSEGTSTTKGTSSTDGSSSGKSTTWNGLDRSTSTNSGTSESYSTSESTAQSSTTGQNRSLTQAADIAKRNVILAAQFQSLPMTTKAAGVNGYIAHHLGASPFQLKGFEQMLLPSDQNSPRVVYRDAVEQFLKLWTPEEEAVLIPTPPTPSPEPSAGGASIKEAQSRYKKGRFLPTTDAENGLRMRDN